MDKGGSGGIDFPLRWHLLLQNLLPPQKRNFFLQSKLSIFGREGCFMQTSNFEGVFQSSRKKVQEKQQAKKVKSFF